MFLQINGFLFCSYNYNIYFYQNSFIADNIIRKFLNPKKNINLKKK